MRLHANSLSKATQGTQTKDYEPQIARFPQVKRMACKGPTTIYKEMAEGTFPTPVKIGSRSVAWVVAEVRAVIQARIAGWTDDQIRALVSNLRAARQL